MTTAAVADTALSRSGFEMVIEPNASRVALTRRVTARHLRQWELPKPLADDILLAVSELVTNAVCHGQGELVGLRVWYSAGELTVEVSDENLTPARPRSAGETDEHGRGLHLVAALSHDWGTSRNGRRTWCTFTVHARRCAVQGTSFKDAV
ncbi:ATP-binding protein [Streptomyces sp. NPDC006990]|uniref:ATP-binding protein n=1 Tax=Streptomyces sp. NPDC006990 TaxID=3154481 RepID=UPI003454063F